MKILKSFLSVGVLGIFFKNLDAEANSFFYHQENIHVVIDALYYKFDFFITLSAVGDGVNVWHVFVLWIHLNEIGIDLQSFGFIYHFRRLFLVENVEVKIEIV
jgi:hypothetical protein